MRAIFILLFVGFLSGCGGQEREKEIQSLTAVKTKLESKLNERKQIIEAKEQERQAVAAERKALAAENLKVEAALKEAIEERKVLQQKVNTAGKKDRS